MLGASVVLCAAAAAVTALLDTPLWSRLLVAGVVLAVGLIGVVDTYLVGKRTKQQAARKELAEATAKADQWLRAVQACVYWELPRMADVDMYEQLGVARADSTQAAAVGTTDGCGYIERDVDRAARKQLQAHGAVLLNGAPGSGVTRTAYQVALSVPKQPLVVASVTPQGLPIALGALDILSAVRPGAQLVLWLDRIDALTEAGLTAQMLRECANRSPGLRIVATVPSTYYVAWAAENQTLDALFEEPLTVERRPSERERQRAELAYPGRDFSEGIAVAFTVGGKLLRRLRAGNHGCRHDPADDDCAVARAVMAVALEWAGTGIDAPIPALTLARLVQQRFGTAVVEPGHVDAALAWATQSHIGGASLLTASGNDGAAMVTAHPVLTEIHRAEDPEAADEVWTAALNDAAGRGDHEAVGRIGFRAHTTGTLAVAAHAWQSLPVEGPSEWLWRAAEFSRGRGEYAAAVPPLERLSEITEAIYGADHPQTADAVEVLAGNWVAAGDQPERVRGLFERALSIREKEFGRDSEEVARTLASLGAVVGKLGNLALGRLMLEESLTTRERLHGSESAEVAHVLVNLATLEGEEGNIAEARDKLQRARRIQEAIGVEDPYVIAGLASMLRQEGSLIEARTLLQQVLDIEVGRYGRAHPYVANAQIRLAQLLSNMGHGEKAIELCERALRTLTRVRGPNHAETAAAMAVLGNAWHRAGQAEKGKALLQRALTIQEEILGPEDPALGQTLNLLGMAWGDLGRMDTAYALFQRALSVQETAWGDCHQGLMGVLGNLGGAAIRLGDRDQARAHVSRALSIAQMRYPGNQSVIHDITGPISKADPSFVVLADGQAFGFTDSK
ncbi:hypothetical protein BTO20_02655 [Mycobacterium dioxanotrophicus]|uniref:Uncharacterized protein n=1 Tax=Mycobacterium dioxanotrophicus TaxID=482462 RepID=A0A1Y0BXG6_9MYCO|nr:hypothetical protein BTO20_02655 [Mycobacterium dioxanotrophicus]